MRVNEIVIDQAQRGMERQAPKDFRTDLTALSRIMQTLREAEEDTRKGAPEDGYKTKMSLGTYFEKQKGYEWLAKHIYQSCVEMVEEEACEDSKLLINALQKLALLEETSGNLDTALQYLKRAVRVSKKNQLEEDDPVRQSTHHYISRLYCALSLQYINKDDVKSAKKAARYCRKAFFFAPMESENKAACQALLGRALMKFDSGETAVNNFESYLKFSQENNNKYGICTGYFALSEIHKKRGNLEESKTLLTKCLKIAKENEFAIPFIFSSINIGQIETAERSYFLADKQFEAAYGALSTKEKFPPNSQLSKLCSILFGIGRAHLTFHRLIGALQESSDVSLIEIIKWKCRGGVFMRDTSDTRDHLIDLEQPELLSQEHQDLGLLEALLSKELEAKID